MEVKNTSDQEMNVTPQLKNALSHQGYRIVTNPNTAHYLLQANIKTVGKMSRSASESALGGGYGSAIAGGIVGAAAGSFTGTDAGILAGGLAGGVVGLAADALVKEVNYTMVTDVQISERVAGGIVINEQKQSHLQQGSATHTVQTSSTQSKYQKYRTRIVSNADKVNLKFADAQKALEQGLVKTITGMF